MSMKSLFRQEAIEAQRQKALGELSVAQPIPAWLFTFIAVAFAAVAAVFVYTGHYTRRERVDGYLALDAGAAQIRAPESGTVTELLVREGDEIESGAPIARLTLERATAGRAQSELVEREMHERLAAIEAEKNQNRMLGSQRAEQERRKVELLRREMQQASAEIDLQRQRVAQTQDEVSKAEDLVRRGFYSDDRLRMVRSELFDQKARLNAAERARTATQRELDAAQLELPSIDIQRQTQEEQLIRQGSQLQEELAQEEARRETVIRAPISGIVTNIAVARGDSVAADHQLATLLPRGSGLRAELLVPTRAIGFVAPGNRVVLRYEAFPFQRFGQYGGTVQSVGQTVWSQGDAIGPLTAHEPVYRIDVKLDSQTVDAGTQHVPLRPGMLVNADLLLERRTVFEWIFEPVIALRARLQ
ncbi:MAG TPA: HlyD family efflux transporter periplasmic adaptor subunit [Burkholderiaceae bacterium]|nr:HlyD family efflux transporter periplasmic adaptor subunit [Burkholderiaceae bacterium]